MRIPFSYKQSPFKAILVISLIGHGAFFLQNGFFSAKPEYAVETAPSSMEAILVKEEIKEKKELEEKVLTANQPVPDSPKVVQSPEEEKTSKEEIPKPVEIPLVRGVLDKARPDYFKNPAPIYPLKSREKGEEGIVLLKVWIDENGHPLRIKIKNSSGFSLLDEAALKAVRKWAFYPAHIGNIKLKSVVDIPVQFVLDR